MNQFERGFAAGELRAWKDRGKHIRYIAPSDFRDEYERGWWAGYEPRSREWAMRHKAQCHWSEREEQAA